MSVLLNDLDSPNEQNKDSNTTKVLILKFLPWILTGVFGILSIVFICLYGIEKKVKNPIDKSHFIPIKERTLIRGIEGAKALQGKFDYLESDYFKIPDIYNMKSTSTRAIHTNFKTYQQTSELSDVCSYVIMMTDYFNMTSPSERQFMKDFGFPDPYSIEDMSKGVKVIRMDRVVNYLKTQGFKVKTNSDFPDDSPHLSDYLSFSKNFMICG